MRFASQRASWHLGIEEKHVDIAYNLEHQKKNKGGSIIKWTASVKLENIRPTET